MYPECSAVPVRCQFWVYLERQVTGKVVAKYLPSL